MHEGVGQEGKLLLFLLLLLLLLFLLLLFTNVYTHSSAGQHYSHYWQGRHNLTHRAARLQEEGENQQLLRMEMKSLLSSLHSFPLPLSLSLFSLPPHLLPFLLLLSSSSSQIIDELLANDVQIYEFPTSDENVAEVNDKMNVGKRFPIQFLLLHCLLPSSSSSSFSSSSSPPLQRQLPFAVVGSREEADVGGRKVRCRAYPWGVVEGQWRHTMIMYLVQITLPRTTVENEAHCDFVKLREMLLR